MTVKRDNLGRFVDPDGPAVVPGTVTIDLFDLQASDKARERNAKRQVKEGYSDYRGYLCEAPVSEDWPHHIVVVDGGDTGVLDEDDANQGHPGYRACDPVGPSCWKKIIRAFKAKGVKVTTADNAKVIKDK